MPSLFGDAFEVPLRFNLNEVQIRIASAKSCQSANGSILLKNSDIVFRQQDSALDEVLSATMIRTIGLL